MPALTRLWRRWRAERDAETLLKSQIRWMARSSESIVVTTTDLDNGPTIVYANPAFCAMTGYRLDELIGCTPRILQGPATNRAILDKLRADLRAGHTFHGQTINYRKDGTPYLVNWRVWPLMDDQGNARYYISFQNNLSAQHATEEQLQLSEARYRSISEMIVEYTYALMWKDEPKQFLWVTDQFAQLTGLTFSSQLTLADFEARVHPDDVPLFRLHYRMASYGEDMSEFRVMGADGQYRWLRDVARPHSQQDGQSFIYGAAYDITELITAQDALKTHALQQAVIAELGQLSLGDIDIEIFLEQVTRLVGQVLTIPICHILIRNGYGHWHYEQGFGWSASKIAAYEALLQTANLDAVASGNDTYITQPNTDPDPTLAKFMRESGVSSAIWTPIQVNGAPYGLLVVYATDTHFPSRDETNFLQSVANLIGVYITRQRIQTAEREQRQLAEALRDVSAILTRRFELKEVFDNILEAAQTIIPTYEAGTIMLLSDDGQTISVISARGYDAVYHEITQRLWHRAEMPPVNHMISTRQPIIIPDTHQSDKWNFIEKTPNIRSYLGAPIFADDVCIGVINLDSFKPNAFSAKDAEKLATLANHASIAIQNVRYAQDLEARVAQRTSELRAEQERLQAIINAAGEGIFYTEGFFIQFANEALAHITGFSLAELIGQPSRILQPTDITPSERRELEAIFDTMIRRKIYRGETRLRRKDGSSFIANITITKIGDSIDPATLRAVTVLRDISEEKNLQAQKQRFIDHAAHELRSPITGLNTRLYLMQRQPEKMDEHLKQLEKILQRMNRLVESLLDLSRFEKGVFTLQLQDVIAQNVISDVVETYRPQADIKSQTIIQELPSAPIHLLADGERLAQVLTNLLVNAINYTPEGGQIRLHLRLEDAFAIIVVTDNGKGIEPDRMPYIFEAFYRAGSGEIKGFGLGLSIAKGIVEQHGGHIRVESQPNNGTSFTIYLPLHPTSEKA